MAISDVRIWMIKNKLKVNDQKTEFLVISQPHLVKKTEDLKVVIGNSEINQSLHAKNLGVTFDQSLTMERHVSNTF